MKKSTGAWTFCCTHSCLCSKQSLVCVCVFPCWLNLEGDRMDISSQIPSVHHHRWLKESQYLEHESFVWDNRNKTENYLMQYKCNNIWTRTGVKFCDSLFLHGVAFLDFHPSIISYLGAGIYPGKPLDQRSDCNPGRLHTHTYTHRHAHTGTCTHTHRGKRVYDQSNLPVFEYPQVFELDSLDMMWINTCLFTRSLSWWNRAETKAWGEQAYTWGKLQENLLHWRFPGYLKCWMCQKKISLQCSSLQKDDHLDSPASHHRPVGWRWMYFTNFVIDITRICPSGSVRDISSTWTHQVLTILLLSLSHSHISLLSHFLPASLLFVLFPLSSAWRLSFSTGCTLRWLSCSCEFTARSGPPNV